MSTESTVSQALRHLGHCIGDRIVTDVPDGLAACEFECRKRECSVDAWIECPNRLRFMQPETKANAG